MIVKEKKQKVVNYAKFPDIELPREQFIKRMKSKPQNWGALGGGDRVRHRMGNWIVSKHDQFIKSVYFDSLKRKREKLTKLVKEINELNGYYIESSHY